MTEKIAVVAPMPSVSAATAAIVKPGLRRSVRRACFRSRRIWDTGSLSVYHAAFHHEGYSLQDVNVRQRVAGNCDDVGEVSGLERADLAFPAEQFGAIQSPGLQRGEWRHGVVHQQRGLTRVRAVGEGADI